MITGLKIEGTNELEAKLRRMIESVEPRRSEVVLMKAARRLRDWIKPDAPIGPTAKLRSAIRAFKGRRGGKSVASAIVWVDKKAAPYLHFVAGGTKPHPIRAKSGRVLRNSVAVFGTQVNHPGAKANSFFQDAVKDASGPVLQMVTADLQAEINAAAK